EAQNGAPASLPARFWGLVVLTGLGGGLLMVLLRLVQHFCWSYQTGDFLNAVQHATTARRVGILVGAGAIAAVIRWLLQKQSTGQLSELTAAIWFRSGRMAPLSTVTNAVLSIVLVAMGASLGRESAPKQIGALTASVLAGWTSLPPTQRRLLAACGAGAGMAAVYNIPFGGALFALEVLLGTLSLPLIAPAMATSFIAVAVSWLFLPDRPTYAIPFYGISAGLVVWALLAGPLAGLASVAYVRVISWADARKPKGLPLLIVPISVFGILGCLSIVFPQLLGNGKDVVQLAFLGQVGVPLLLSLVVLKPVMTAACIGSGAPGGLFTPTLTYGALLGGLLGHGWALLWADAAPGTYALIGAGAVLAATTQGPVSAMVMLMELTRRLDTLMVPMLIAVAGAVVVARLFESRSIYSGRIHTGRAATRARQDGRALAGDFEVISAAAHYGELLHLLLKLADHPKPLYVADERGRLVGEVSRQKVLDPDASLVPLETATAADFVTPVVAGHA
ncbi:MAG: chloride channel protein, partial [Pseudomonadota bacterium]|nr:chloride channel protein [Pseudomonadota bacterium]